MLQRTGLFLIFFCYSYFIENVNSQKNDKDSSEQKQTIRNIVSFYSESIGQNLELYNGTEYSSNYRGIIGHPFFGHAGFQTESIYYDGTLYLDVPLAYDLVRDEVITKDNRGLNMKLIPEKIGYFSLLDHVFVRIIEDSTNHQELNTGFYDVINNGPVMALAKRKKVIKQPLHAEDPDTIIGYDEYFVKKGDVYYKISGKSSLLDLFSDQKEEIKKFLRKNKFNMKKDMETAISKTVEFYTQLKK